LHYRRPGFSARSHGAARLAGILLFALLAVPAQARMDKPTLAAEDFFRLLAVKDYDEAAHLLSEADHQALKDMQSQAGEAGKNISLSNLLADSFYLMHPGEGQGTAPKAPDQETIMPQRIGFFVPGQHYIIGNFAVVFTRETYELTRDTLGPVRDDPRKLWIDPTNVLSQVRDEAYFKEWWIWEDERLTMPGLLWMVKEKNQWKVDLFGGAVPRKSFQKILRWHFGREVFEPEKAKAGKAAAKPGSSAGGPEKPKPTPGHNFGLRQDE